MPTPLTNWSIWDLICIVDTQDTDTQDWENLTLNKYSISPTRHQFAPLLAVMNPKLSWNTYALCSSIYSLHKSWALTRSLGLKCTLWANRQASFLGWWAFHSFNHWKKNTWHVDLLVSDPIMSFRDIFCPWLTLKPISSLIKLFSWSFVECIKWAELRLKIDLSKLPEPKVTSFKVLILFNQCPKTQRY